MDNELTLQHRWYMWRGWVYVPLKHVQVVVRDEQFYRLLGPGYHPPLSRRNERLGKLISTDFRVVTSPEKQVPTVDLIGVRVGVTVGFRFDPRKCDSERQTDMIEMEQHKLNEMVKEFAFQTARRKCSNWTVDALCNGCYRQQLEQAVLYDLRKRLAPFGVLLGDTSITIEITPPPNMAQTWEEAMLDKYMSAFSDKTARHLLAKQSDTMHLVLSETGSVVPPTPVPYVRPPASNGVAPKEYNRMGQEGLEGINTDYGLKVSLTREKR